MAGPYRLPLDLTAEQLAALRREAGCKGVSIGHLVLKLGGLDFSHRLGLECDRLISEHERIKALSTLQGQPS